MDIIKNNLYKEKNPIFSVPKGKLTLESPEKLDTFEDSLFTCYAFANNMPLPSDLNLKLTSHQTDHLAELSSSDAVELQSGSTFSQAEDSEGILQNRTSRGLIIKPSVAQYKSFVGVQLTYECDAMVNSCHDQTMFEPIAKNISLYLNGIYDFTQIKYEVYCLFRKFYHDTL